MCDDVSRDLPPWAYWTAVNEWSKFRGALQKVLKEAVHEGLLRFPEAREASWQLVRGQEADGQLESAIATLTPLLIDEPDNPTYLMMSADLEFSLCLAHIRRGFPERSR
jgi:hypothetical protein